MRKLLLARYRRDGYAFCNIRLVDLPAFDDAPASEAFGPPRQRLRILIEEGPKVTVRDIDFVGMRRVCDGPIEASKASEREDAGGDAAATEGEGDR